MANRIEKIPREPVFGPGGGGSGPDAGGGGGGGGSGGNGLPPYSTPCFNAILELVRYRWQGYYIEWVPTTSNLTAYFRVVADGGIEIQVMGKCIDDMTTKVKAKWRQLRPFVGEWNAL